MNRVLVDAAAVAKMYADVRTRWRFRDAKQTAQQDKLEGSELERTRERFAKVATMIVNAIDAKVCPNWKLTDDEKAKLEQSTAEVVALYAPADLDFESLHPLWKFAFVAGVITVQRVDFEQHPFPAIPFVPGLIPLHAEAPADGSADTAAS